MLRDDINNAVKDAMKAKEERKLSTLRMVNSTIKNADIAARGEGKPPLSDADLLGVFQKMIKQRQESVELYDKGGRAELAAQEREEIAIISAYLPKQMSDDEVKAAISAAIAETGAAGMKDMGKVIGVLRAKFAGQMDFGKASGMVKAALTGVSLCSTSPRIFPLGPYWAAANNSQWPGMPLRSNAPRSVNLSPAPATRSVTTRDTRTSFAPHCAITRAAACTAIPPTSWPRTSISPVCRPARRGRPICCAAAPKASAQRTARPGPSKVARMPSPVLFTKFPRCFSTVCFARRS